VAAMLNHSTRQAYFPKASLGKIRKLRQGGETLRGITKD
jgi:hypothetical protein